MNGNLSHSTTGDNKTLYLISAVLFFLVAGSLLVSYWLEVRNNPARATPPDQGNNDVMNDNGQEYQGIFRDNTPGSPIRGKVVRYTADSGPASATPQASTVATFPAGQQAKPANYAVKLLMTEALLDYAALARQQQHIKKKLKDIKVLQELWNISHDTFYQKLQHQAQAELRTRQQAIQASSQAYISKLESLCQYPETDIAQALKEVLSAYPQQHKQAAGKPSVASRFVAHIDSCMHVDGAPPRQLHTLAKQLIPRIPAQLEPHGDTP